MTGKVGRTAYAISFRNRNLLASVMISPQVPSWKFDSLSVFKKLFVCFVVISFDAVIRPLTAKKEYCIQCNGMNYLSIMVFPSDSYWSCCNSVQSGLRFFFTYFRELFETICLHCNVQFAWSVHFWNDNCRRNVNTRKISLMCEKQHNF